MILSSDLIQIIFYLKLNEKNSIRSSIIDLFQTYEMTFWWIKYIYKFEHYVDRRLFYRPEINLLWNNKIYQHVSFDVFLI